MEVLATSVWDKEQGNIYSLNLLKDTLCIVWRKQRVFYGWWAGAKVRILEANESLLAELECSKTWNVAKAISLFNKRDRSDTSYYKCINLLNAGRKIFNKIVNNSFDSLM